jgi:hypothetical protein
MTTYTPIARLPIMTPADPAVKDSWGLIVNAAFPAIEQVAAGISTVDLTGVITYTLSVANDAPDQARSALLMFIGAPTAACTVTIPSVARMGWVVNKSSQNVILATAAAVTNLTVAPGSSFLYTCDGAAVTAVIIGGIGVLNANAGVLIANGSTYQATDTAGVSRALLGIDTNGNTNLYMGGVLGWQVLNRAGTASLFAILPSGAASFAQGLTVAGPLAVGGTLAVTGTTSLTNLTVSGTVAFTTTPTNAAGVISTGFDAGGMQARYVGGVYGSGWRNDGANTYLLVSAANAPLGIYNGLRPFFFNNVTGAVNIDFTGVGTGFGGAINVTGRVTGADMVFTTGSAYFNNSTGIQMKDPGGTYRWFAYTGADNWTNLFQSGSAGWRVFNQAGTLQLFLLDPTGNATFNGNVSTPGIFATNGGNVGGVTFGSGTINATGAIAAGGNVTGIGGIFTNASIPGFLNGGTSNWSGMVNFNGSQALSATGGVVDGTGSHGAVSYSVGVSLQASAGVAGAGFYATSDVRLKTEIADIDTETAYDWINRGRPRSYIMEGRFHAGFVAQEEVDNGREAAVVAIPDPRPLFAVSDGYAPAGARLARRYEHDIAYLTAALQGALARITALEAPAAAV